MTSADDDRSPRHEEAPRVSIARLPATSAELFGREADLAWLDACWREGVHVASVVAWGGVGKTALVNRWLAGLRDKGWGGAARVWGWSFYSQGTDRLSSSDEFVATLLRELGDPDPATGSPWDKGERLAKLARKERTILVLDGVEPLQWGPGVQEGRLKDPALQALLKELAAQNKGLCLVTSRISLTDLEALSGSRVRERKLDNLSPEAGAALLKARGAKGTDKELRKASDEYGGHGLALTLLGSYLAEVAEGDIRRRKEIGPLEEAEKHGGHARRVMATYEPWLGAPELAILRMMGLFDRQADDDEIRALRAPPMIPSLTDGLAGISGRDWNRAVAKLRKIGLLSAKQDKRLDAHPLVREHFGEQLKKRNLEGWREGHARLYEHLRRSAKELPDTIEEMAPLYAAVVHGCMAGKNQEAFDEVYWKRIQRESKYFALRKLGAFGSELSVLSSFFDQPWEQLAPGLSEVWQAEVLNNAGFALRALGRLPEATGLMRLSLRMGIAREDWKEAAIRASNLSEFLRTQGELREASAAACKSVELADKSGDALWRMASRTALAATELAMGHPAEAAALFEEAERMQEKWQPVYPMLYSVQGFHYCNFLLDKGQDAETRGRAAQTLAWAQAHLGLLANALNYISLGRANLGAGGDVVKATSQLHRAVNGLRGCGDQAYLPFGLLARAALHIHNADHAAARHDLDETLTLATRCEFRLHEADAHLGLCRLALAEHNPADALAHLAKAKALIEKTGYHRRDGELAELETAIHSAPRPPGSGGLRAPNRSGSPEPPLPGGRGAESVFAITAASPAPLPAPSIAMANSTSTRPVDFLIFAPLEEERDAVLSKLPGHRKLDGDGKDAQVYYEAEVATCRDDKAVYRVIVTSPKDMGPIHAAVTAAAIATRWEPHHVLVVGIAGGLKKEVALGDVAVAQDIADYGLGKVEDGKEREERWKMYPSDPTLFNAANNFASGFVDLVTTPRPKGTEGPRRHSGVIASGGDVIAAQQVVAAYRKDMPKLIGVEMEGAGVATALASHALRPRLLMIRGISDLADAKGNATMKKKWRAYARDVAAAYAIGLLRDGPVPAAASPR